MVHHQSETATPNRQHQSDVFEQFEIVFNKGDNPVFFGDEPIVGHLRIKLKNETYLNAIHVQFKGARWVPNFGEAKWVGTGRTEDKEGQTEKIYFDKNFVLLERPPGHPEPGHFKFVAQFAYSLPFECPLPHGCETSYESGTAHIRYFARAVLETEQREKFVAKKAFSIVCSPSIDQLIPPPPEPIARKETVRFGGCCCRNRIDAEVQLPKSAYAPGENIVGTFYIDSRTARYAVDHIEVRLLDGAERVQPDQSAGAAAADQKKHHLNQQQMDNAVPETTDQSAELASEKQKKKKQQSAKKQKPTPRPKHTKGSPAEVTSLCQRVVAGSKLDSKALLTAEPEKHGKRRRSARVGMDNVVLIKVPAVIPTIETGEADDQHQQQFLQTNKHGEPAQVQDEQRVLMESPSTATIRARREPFIGVRYALQVALGTHILLEVPIKVVPPVSRGAICISFAPFACGAQPITEPDEANLGGGPFTFTPQYPMYNQSPSPPQSSAEVIKTTTIVDELVPADQSPNGTATARDGGIVPMVSEVRKTITTTTVYQKQLQQTALIAEEQHQLVMMPNGAKPYQHHQQQNNDHHEGRQQAQEEVIESFQIGQQQQHHLSHPQHIDQQQMALGMEDGGEIYPQNATAQNGVEAEPALNGQLNGDVHPNDKLERHVFEETYVVENEDGTKKTIHTSTERHFTTTNTTAAPPNDEDDGIKTDQQHQQLLRNQQMDVSMSG